MLKTHLHKSTFDREKRLINHNKLAWLFLLVCIVLSLDLSKVYAQQASLDYQVKAAMAYKFLGYSEWPEKRFNDSHSPYRIWVLGSADIKNELQNIVAHRIINGRSIEVYSATAVDQIDNAHIVFVARDMEALLPKLAMRAEKNSYLIVTENEQGLVSGSTINLRLVDGRIGFDISLKCAQTYGITLSSRLLPIAVSIEEGNR